MALAPLIDALMLRRADGSWVALLPLQPLGDKLDLPAVQQALKGLPGVQTLEIGAELTRLYARYLGVAQTQALLGALGVVALVAFSLRSLPRVLAVCQPLLVSVLLTMGGLAACGVQLGILHLVGLLLVVAVGSNYALFFDHLGQQAGAELIQGPAQRDQTRNDTLASLLLANLTTVVSFGLLATSSVGALSAIGQVVAPGALLALLLSAAFMAPRHATRSRAAA
jgi:predicted exporter